MRRVPDDAELLFVETVSTGTVHFLVTLPSWREDPADVVQPVTAEALADALGRPVVVRCGQRTAPVAERRHRYTDRFDDDRLCGGCYRTLHPGDQARAFEHARPGDAEPE